MTLLDYQLVLGRRNIRPPHFASKVSYSASPQASVKCPRGAPCRYVIWLKTAQRFLWILNTHHSAPVPAMSLLSHLLAAEGNAARGRG